MGLLKDYVMNLCLSRRYESLAWCREVQALSTERFTTTFAAATALFLDIEVGGVSSKLVRTHHARKLFRSRRETSMIGGSEAVRK